MQHKRQSDWCGGESILGGRLARLVDHPILQFMPKSLIDCSKLRNCLGFESWIEISRFSSGEEELCLSMFSEMDGVGRYKLNSEEKLPMN